MGIINGDYKDGFLRHVQNAIEGKQTFIENPIEGLEHWYNLLPGRFTLIGASSGVGKSAFLDYQFILAPWDRVRDDKSIHYEVLYYSQERKKLLKHAKWVSYFLYRDYKWLIPADKLLGWDPAGLPPESVQKIIRSYDSEISELLDIVHITDGRVTTDRIANDIRKKMTSLGTLYVADDFGVSIESVPIEGASFSPNKTRPTRVGPEQFVELKHGEIKFTMTPNNTKYFPHKENTFVYVILDGVGLIEKARGQSTKQAVDDVTDLLADARDIYGVSPVMVSQFNRSIADIHRQKAHGADLTPQEGDFRDSAGPYQAADLVLGLFDPIRFKAYDEAGMYGDYDVRAGMMSPRGIARFRSLHLLKNSFGIDGLACGLKFMGEVGSFTKLPSPQDPAIAKVYGEVALNK